MPRTPKIVIQSAKNKQTFVSLKGGNGEKIANTETYKSPSGARAAASRLKGLVRNASIVDKTKKS